MEIGVVVLAGRVEMLETMMVVVPPFGRVDV